MNNADSLIQRVAEPVARRKSRTSIAELDAPGRLLQCREGQRVPACEISGYAQLSQAAVKSPAVIAEQRARSGNASADGLRNSQIARSHPLVC